MSISWKVMLLQVTSKVVLSISSAVNIGHDDVDMAFFDFKILDEINTTRRTTSEETRNFIFQLGPLQRTLSSTSPTAYPTILAHYLYSTLGFFVTGPFFPLVAACLHDHPLVGGGVGDEGSEELGFQSCTRSMSSSFFTSASPANPPWRRARRPPEVVGEVIEIGRYLRREPTYTGQADARGRV